MADLRRKLEQLLASGGRAVEPLRPGRLLVYGAGNCGCKVASRAREAGFELAAYVDSRAGDLTSTDGVPCFAPESLEVGELARQGEPVVIGVFNHATDITPIRNKLRDLGFTRIVTYPEFHEQFGDSNDFWLTNRSYYQGKADQVLKGLDFFADKVSRQVYYDTMASRLNCDEEALQNPDVENQYLPPDLPPPASPMRLIDGGAFTGDTLELFLRHGIKFEAVAAFEPDIANYRMLETTVARCGRLLGEVNLFPCGVGERKETLGFHSGDGSGSAIGGDGETKIQVRALDEVIPNFAPTFIKLDIEGAEPLALRGAAGLIRESHPRLAVCAYHEPDHLWTIPKLIRELEPTYRLALRYHQWNGFDLVVYAF